MVSRGRSGRFDEVALFVELVGAVGGVDAEVAGGPGRAIRVPWRLMRWPAWTWNGDSPLVVRASGVRKTNTRSVELVPTQKPSSATTDSTVTPVPMTGWPAHAAEAGRWHRQDGLTARRQRRRSSGSAATAGHRHRRSWPTGPRRPVRRTGAAPACGAVVGGDRRCHSGAGSCSAAQSSQVVVGCQLGVRRRAASSSTAAAVVGRRRDRGRHRHRRRCGR